MTARGTAESHHPAQLRWRDGGFGTSCACGAAWPCPHYVPPAPSAPPPPPKPGDLCPDCGPATGLRLRDRAGLAVCPDCDEYWLELPPPSECRVLWEDGDLYLNELWVGSAAREVRPGAVADPTRPYAVWLRGRGWDTEAHRDEAAARARLLEWAAREIEAEGRS